MGTTDRITDLEQRIIELEQCVRDLGKLMVAHSAGQVEDLEPVMRMLDQHEVLAMRVSGMSWEEIEFDQALSRVRVDMKIKREIEEAMK